MTGCQHNTPLLSSRSRPRKTVLAWTLAAALGMAAVAGNAQAVSLGHARVVSAPGAPLQVVVPLTDLTPEEAANLQVSLASDAAWQQAGLQPPTPLADMRAALETGANGSRQVRVSSSQPPGSDAIDVLLDVQSSAGQRQLQVTVLVPASDITAGIRQASAGATRPTGGASAGQVKVLPGQTLWGIASSHAVANATIYQELVALWRANPQAFIQNNMNLVRSGSTLSLPDAATVQSIDPAEARRIFEEQAAAFQRYRGRLGAGAHGAAAPAPSSQGAAAGKVESGEAANKAVAPSAQDQLRLSSPSQADAKADADASNQHAMEDANKRIDELKSNVQALSQAAGAATAGNGPGAAGNGQGSAAASGAASGGSSTSSTANTVEHPPVTGPSSPTAAALDEAKDTAKQVVDKSGLSDWLPDNLLIVITAALAVIIFVVAWVLRRAGQRRNDDDDDSYGYAGYAEPTVDHGATESRKDIDPRVSSINLDLDKPSGEEHPHGGRA